MAASSSALKGAKFLGSERSKAEGSRAIVVMDGKGAEIRVPAHSQQVIRVEIDDGYIYWRNPEMERMEEMPHIERTRIPWTGTNLVQVRRESPPTIEWNCYQSPIAKFPPKGANAGVSVSGDAFSQIAQTPTKHSSERDGLPTSASHASNIATTPTHRDSVLKEVVDYVEEEPKRLSYLTLCGGIVVSLYGLVGLLNIFGFFEHPFSYGMNLFVVFFGMVTCVMEMEADRPSDASESTLYNLQSLLDEWANALTTLWGRGFFNLFQGSFIVFSSATFNMGIFIGVYLMFVGVLHLFLYLRTPVYRAPQYDYIRIT